MPWFHWAQKLGIGDDPSQVGTWHHVTSRDFWLHWPITSSLDHHLNFRWCCCWCWPGAQFTVWAPPGCPCITCRRCARHDPRLSERLSERLTKGSVMLCCCVELIWNPTFAEANSVQCPQACPRLISDGEQFIPSHGHRSLKHISTRCKESIGMARNGSSNKSLDMSW